MWWFSQSDLIRSISRPLDVNHSLVAYFHLASRLTSHTERYEVVKNETTE